MEQKHIHVSFDLVDEFIPRVPKRRAPGEDDRIPRICVSDQLLNCINSMPFGPQALKDMESFGISIVIHAYYLKGDKIITTDEVAKYVPDAEYFQESWLLTAPTSIRRIDYRIENMQFDQSDGGALILLFADFTRCRFIDNKDEIVKKLHIRNADAFDEMVKRYGTASIFYNLSEKFREILQKGTTC